MLAEAAISVGIAVVADICATLEPPHPLLEYNALTAPSWYALCEFARRYGHADIFDHNHGENLCSSYADGRFSVQSQKIDPNRMGTKFVGLYRTPPSVGSFDNSTSHFKCPALCADARGGNSTISNILHSASSQGSNRCSDSCVVVGFVGRLAKVKSAALFLLSAKHLILGTTRTKPCYNCVFVVIGSGQLRFVLEEFTRKLRIQDRVQFIGSVSI
jgi:glycosyltransferase involved in cell wall biosynthesis